MEGRLQELCSKMYTQGYNYASFQNINGKEDIILQKAVDISPKPKQGLYFSKLREYNKDFGLSDSKERSRVHSRDKFVYPEWYKFLKKQDFDVDVYESKGIIFAKIDESKLKNLKNVKPSKPENTFQFVFVPEYNWGEIDECGIIVNDNKSLRENGWDIEQCVVWNKDCITDYKFFQNTGKRISYKEVNCEIKNMDLGEQVAKLTKDFSNMIGSIFKFT